jgi:hypothetical protein
MIKLADLSKDYLTQLPQITEEEVRILWHNDYYDGPRNGVLLYRDKAYCFQLQEDDPDSLPHSDKINEAETGWYARFLVIELTDEQLQEEKYWNDLFRQKVGTHWDYDENGKYTKGELRPREMWEKFYSAVKDRKPLDLSDNTVVGWFER